MKKITITLLAALAVSGGLNGCSMLTRGFEDNPNTASDAPATLQLTAAQLAEGFFMSGESARTANIWAGAFRGFDRQYQALQNYITTTQDYNNPWTQAYQESLTQLRIVESKASTLGNRQLLGIAQVTEAQMIGTVTSLWGSVPYSQAFVENTPPAFDAQADVYAAIQTLLTTAITNLSVTSGAGASIPADIYYGGNRLRWIAAAHSLKARYYLHTKNYAQALTEAQQGISASTNDMLMPYDGVVSVSANPYWDFINNRTNYIDGVDAYAPGLLLARINTKTNETGRYKYFYNDSDPDIYSPRDPNWIDGAFQADSDFPLISYVETQAIAAECQARAGNTSGALTAINN
ncbi:MAG: SusD/RagB family nutrient-binding outer membrane lipoprotein, partial [Hymenobacter sp.]